MKVIRATLRPVRLLVSDKKHALEILKGPYVELGADRDRFIERSYNATVQGYLALGVIDEKLPRERNSLAAERNLKTPVPPERVFDFGPARKAGEGLR